MDDSDNNVSDGRHEMLVLKQTSLQDFAEAFCRMSFQKPTIDMKRAMIVANDKEDVLLTLAILGLRTDDEERKKILKNVIFWETQRRLADQEGLAPSVESMALMAELCTKWTDLPGLDDLGDIFVSCLLFSEIALLVCDYPWEQNKSIGDFLARHAGDMIRYYSKYLSPDSPSYSASSDRFISRLIHAVMTFSAPVYSIRTFFTDPNVVSFMMRDDFDADAEIAEKLKMPIIHDQWTKDEAFFESIPRSLLQNSNVFLRTSEHMTAKSTFVYDNALSVFDDLQAFFDKKHPITHKSPFKTAVENYTYYVKSLRVTTFAEYAVDLSISTDSLLSQDPRDETPSVLFLLCKKDMRAILRRIVLARTHAELKIEIGDNEELVLANVARRLVQREEASGVMSKQQANLCFAYIEKVFV